jgi:hypothetical protein
MRRSLILIAVLVAIALPYSYSGIHWYNPPPPVHYKINQNGTPDCANEFVMMDNGHQAWTDVASSFFEYIYDGTTPLMPAPAWGSPQTDGNNVSGWVESGWGASSSTIAVNIVWYYPGPNNIIESDQDFNGQNFNWSDSGLAGQMDVWNISSHESGHGLMLGDLYGPADTQKTMFGYSNAGETLKRDLASDDIAGCQYIYPDGVQGVNVTSFTAHRAANGNQVLWQAEEFGDHVGYNLYRCEGAGTVSATDVRRSGFVRVNSGLITGSGTYTYLDRYAGGKRVQYVLADVDSAGRETYHGPTPCDSNNSTYALSLKVSPNPARTVTNLSYTLPGTFAVNNSSLRIYDLSGRMIVNHAISNQAGEGSFSWDTATVPSGVYMVSLASGSSKVNSRVVVAH